MDFDLPRADGPFGMNVTERESGARLAALFEEHGRMVYGLCRVLLRDREEAEDASQQTFLSAHASLLNGAEPRNPAAWLATIARNECRGRLRGRLAAPLALVDADGRSDEADVEAGRREEVEALCQALAELPVQQRQAILLREFYGLSYDEVSTALGVTLSAVEALIFRSRRRLQEQLRSVRAASGALVVPVAIREGIAHGAPGFASAGSGGILAATAAKLGSAPGVAKLAAAMLAVTAAATTTAVVSRHAPQSASAATPAGESAHPGGKGAKRLVAAAAAQLAVRPVPRASARHAEREDVASGRVSASDEHGDRAGQDDGSLTVERAEADGDEGPSAEDGESGGAVAGDNETSDSRESGDSTRGSGSDGSDGSSDSRESRDSADSSDSADSADSGESDGSGGSSD
jgi:RNA polymerase sigma-70 factor (ECF subfamily)